MSIVATELTFDLLPPFSNSDCTGQSVGGIVSPGIFDLNDYGFNDRASSYRC